ncbi:hypothetical protein [Pseudomonas phage PA5]|uniref:Uncharacterized protein n=1 Tax=Pseudomonas phage PA5 TaxID=1913570 RepID=A0A1J0MHQ8_9CAUD|nr:hypothetical protein FDH19_gp005 [Pseudomonas phage PA5]APD20703.1 hypothetical protein [Pseudomonas phage PA5]
MSHGGNDVNSHWRSPSNYALTGPYNRVRVRVNKGRKPGLW